MGLNYMCPLTQWFLSTVNTAVLQPSTVSWICRYRGLAIKYIQIFDDVKDQCPLISWCSKVNGASIVLKVSFFFNGFVFLLPFILYWSIDEQKCFVLQVYSKVIQWYIYMYLFIFKFFCHLGCYINSFILIHTFFFRATWRKRSETWTRWLLVNICPQVKVNCATC